MFDRMRLSTMLTLGFGVLILSILVVVASTHWRVGEIHESVDEIRHDIYPNTVAAANIRFNIAKNWANTLHLTYVTDKEAAAKIQAEMTTNSKAITDDFEFLQREFHSEEGKKLVTEALAARENYTSKRKEYIGLLKSEDKEATRAFLVGPLRASLDAYLDSMTRIFSALATRLENESEASFKTVSETRRLNLFMGAATLIAALFVAVSIIRIISKQMGGEVYQARDIARAISEGDLRVDIPLSGQNTDSLLASLKTMRDKLHAMASQIHANARRVGEAASTVSRAAGEVATASANQSDSAGSAAAAVEQLTVSIDHLSKNADEANAYSRQAAELSRNGASVIRCAGGEMEMIARTVESSSSIIVELEHRSNEISVVVNVIKEIADQTNLLALNAAIEAARAGEQGRGFAVVADEVRKLAERTTASTQEIAVTIAEMQQKTQAAVQSMSGGVEQVNAGKRMAEQAGQSIDEIQSGVALAVSAVNDISNALKEQSAATDEIARSIERIASMVSANNTASTHVASAASEMDQLANGLSGSVGFFRI